MALFTSKADSGLPLLTQFYHLEVPYLDELPVHLAGAALVATDPEILQWAEMLRGGYYVPGWPGTESVEDLTEWGYLANLYQILKSFMDCRVDGEVPSPAYVDALNSWLAVVMPAPFVAWNQDGFKFDFPGVSGLVLLVHRPLAMEMLSAFQNGTLRRCEECRSVFVEQKPGQKYCSQRCRTRITSRRRYATLFSEYKPTRRRPESAKNTVQSQ